MNFNSITGHQKQLELLSKALSSGKLAHGYLFAGPEGVGKKTIARRFAHILLGDEKSFNPDFIEIDGKEGIKIDQIRELNYKLSLKPYAAEYKIAVIDSADQMTIEAANALLKVLEEPKSYTIIILITSNPSRLPKTIVSRTQKITFGLVAGREQQPIEEDHYQVFQSAALIDRLILAFEIAGLETPEISRVLESWLLRLSMELRLNPSMKLKDKIENVIASQKFLGQNVNSKLLLTNLMLKT